MPTLRALREQLRSTPDRVRSALHMAKTSGLLWELSAPGLREIAHALLGAAQSPSGIYRVHARNAPNKCAVIWRDRRLTFAQMDDAVEKLAAALSARGIGRGSGVVLMMRNRPEYLQLAAAAARIGAAAVAVSWRSTPSELAFIANHSGARAIVFEAALQDVAAAARAELPSVNADGYIVIGGEAKGATPIEEVLEAGGVFVAERGIEADAAVVVYTSGTTGKPKGAVRRFPKDAMVGFMKFIAETPMRVDDVHLVTCPLYHSTAYAFVSFAHLVGSTAVIMDDFKPEAFLEIVERHRITTTAVVPTMLHRVMDLGRATIERHDTRSLRAIFSNSAPLPAPLALAVMDQFGDVLFNCYGSTETGLVTLATPTDLRAAPGTIGKLVPGNQIRLLSGSGDEVPVGEVGELYVRSQSIMAGYHKDAAATRDSMRDGFMSVGDLARKDRDGRYFIEGRTRDMVISGGVNVYPAEVESVLEHHPDLAEVAVVGVTDPEWGERVRAFVVAKKGVSVDAEALKAWVRERLAGPKVPRDFVFLDALPRNPTGKVLKRELRTHA